jgi:hypothetical protein
MSGIVQTGTFVMFRYHENALGRLTPTFTGSFTEQCEEPVFVPCAKCSVAVESLFVRIDNRNERTCLAWYVDAYIHLYSCARNMFSRSSTYVPLVLTPYSTPEGHFAHRHSEASGGT